HRYGRRDQPALGRAEYRMSEGIAGRGARHPKARSGARTTLRLTTRPVPSKERPVMILPKVRDPRFITLRRGGTLTDSDHHLLAIWAALCAEHVLHLFESVQPADP